MLRAFFSTIAILIVFPVLAQEKNYSSQKKIIVSKAAVVSAHPLASKVGLAMLKAGGNAMDAAIATQLALAVVFPSAGNIGGGGYTIAHFKNGRTLAIDYRETAPSKAQKNMFLDSAGNPVKGLSLKGALASGVPGAVAGIIKSSNFARFPLSRLIAPAITLAEKGFAITAAQAVSLNSNRADFLKFNASPIPFVKDSLWKRGDILIQPDLAQTLKRIRDKGLKGFYEGETAALIEKEMKRSHGIISRDDLKKYQPVTRKLLSFPYKKLEVLSMPLSSSGGLMLQQMLKMVERKNISAMGFQSPAAMQWMIEAERRSFADRAFYLGDNDMVKVPVMDITSDSYLEKLIADVQPGIAGKSLPSQHGQVHVSEETTHLSIIDKDGNAVSITTTLNDSYGSTLVIAGAGFIMNNEMDDFSIKEGHPNMYGAIGNAANAISPGKRMLSSMTPTIVLKNKKPYIIVGTPGGTTIPTSVFQTLVNLVDFNLSAEDAVNMPKFHHQWLPDTVDVEKDFGKEKIQALEKMGYKIRVRTAIGRTELIIVNADGTITAIADKRGDDDARGL
ncbi:MAG: gamma-glutamyltransferase [Ferruginibacter sp.]